VFVYRMICESTFEEKIEEMMRAKRDLSEMTVAVGEKWISELSDDQIKEVFSLNPKNSS